MPRPLVLVAVSCHFKTEEIICNTTRRRLEAVLKELESPSCFRDAVGRPRKVRVILTGDVPRRPGGAKLNLLMYRYLVKRLEEKSLRGGVVIHLSGGVGIFSEARWVAGFLNQEGLKGSLVKVYGSDWYLGAAAPVWRKRLGEYGCEAEFVPVKDSAGEKTRNLYKKYAWLVWLAHKLRFLGAFFILEKLMNFVQGGRKDGFTWNGCA